MAAKERSLITLMVVVGGFFGGGDALASDHPVDKCTEAVVVMSDGRSIRGSVVQLVGDSLWIEVSDSMVRDGGQSSRIFWGGRSGESVEQEVSPGEGGDEPTVSRVISLSISEVSLLRCGDSEWDGAAAGLLSGTAVGGVFGLGAALTQEGPGWPAIPFAVAITAPTFAMYGAIIDRYHGGAVREYRREELSAIGNGPWTGKLPILDRPLWGRIRHGILVGPYVQRITTLKSTFESMYLIGARLTLLSRKGVFGEFSVGRAERQGERWTGLSADAGITFGRFERIHPYGQIGLRHYEREYTSSFRGTIFDPDDRHFLDVTIGGGAFIDAGGGRLLLRPAFILHYPLDNWVGTELEIGLYYGF